jgi:DNA primase large subunit
LEAKCVTIQWTLIKSIGKPEKARDLLAREAQFSGTGCSSNYFFRKYFISLLRTYKMRQYTDRLGNLRLTKSQILQIYSSLLKEAIIFKRLSDRLTIKDNDTKS